VRNVIERISKVVCVNFVALSLFKETKDCKKAQKEIRGGGMILNLTLKRNTVSYW